jgi:hypothetical protein
MKSIIWIILVILSHPSFGQEKMDDYKRLVDSAIVMQTALPIFYETKENIYLINESNESYILSSDKEQAKFKSIIIYSKKNRKLLKKGIRAWKVVPLLNKDKLIVHILDLVVTYKNKRYNFANAGEQRSCLNIPVLRTNGY